MRVASAVGFVAMLSVGCRATSNGPEPGKSASAPSASGAASAPSVAPEVSPSAAAPSSPYPKIGDLGLPKLKPILEKPFPEGASEEVVCEAIENVAEKDLWARFGHIVPMYVFGSVFVVEAKGRSVREVHEFIRDNHYGYDSRTAFCRETALVYVRSLPDDQENYGHKEGRVTLSAQLQSKFSVRVRESYAFPDDQTRLSNYCRADAELCERLVKLDYMNEGRGLCVEALVVCGIGKKSERYPSALDACLRLDATALQCLYASGDSVDYKQCARDVRAILCP